MYKTENYKKGNKFFMMKFSLTTLTGYNAFSRSAKLYDQTLISFHIFNTLLINGYM